MIAICAVGAACRTSEQAADDPDRQRLLARLHERHGIDFQAYKLATITRRLWRRVAAAKTANLADYLAYLETHPDEERRLIADFLIKVTRFFRDPALFARLRDELIPELVEAAQREGRELRLWSAGCATGEEAYSLALLVAEALARHPHPPPACIFATDLDETALAFARRGIYPVSAVADVPAELRARFFIEHDGTVEVAKAVRSLIVFGAHDLAQRPPFPQIDLVLCRNVLIYFTPELQRRALELFAYSLRQDGVLVLGTAETLGVAPAVAGAFVAVDRRLRVYRRQGPRPVLPPAQLPSAAEARLAPGAPVPRSHATLERALLQAETDAQAAQRTTDRAEEIVRQLPVGVAIVDRQYDLAVINGAARALLGIHGVALGQDLIHLAPRIPSTALRAGIDAVFAGEAAQRLETVITAESATGDPRHLAVSCHPSRVDADGRVASVLVLVTDVTAPVAAAQASAAAAARHEAEAAALRQTVERLAAANRQVLAANRELTDSVDRLREQGDELRLAAAAAQVAAEEIETLNEELQSSNEELETLHEEAQATVEELNVANDELQARALELEELAAEHGAEQARLSAVLGSMRDAVLVVDAQGRTSRTNTAYDELMTTLGASFTPADAHGVPLPVAETPQARAARGETFRLEFTVPAADGARRWVEATGGPLVGDAGGVVVLRDITDRTLRQLQDEFLSWAAHELRTPLTAVQGYLQLVARRLGPDADARLQRYLDLALAETRRQASLAAELLDAARLRAGKLAVELAPVDLVPLVGQAVELAEVLARGQTFVLTVDDDPLVVAGDAGRLTQVVLNLLTNAITHAPETEQIAIGLRRDGDLAELVVRDTGPGIPAEALETIFERFAQAHPAGQPGRAGLGLGLYIAREIIAAHGGAITVAFPPGAGATFTVRLPLLAAAPDNR
jgi:two-component system CheB/CheR fusion protein